MKAKPVRKPKPVRKEAWFFSMHFSTLEDALNMAKNIIKSIRFTKTDTGVEVFPKVWHLDAADRELMSRMSKRHLILGFRPRAKRVKI